MHVQLAQLRLMGDALRDGQRGVLRIIKDDSDLPYAAWGEGGACGIQRPIGWAERALQEHERSMRRRLERKGWSMGKIERAVTTSLAVRREQEFSGLRVRDAEALADLASFGDFLLVLDWYEGDVDPRPIFRGATTRLASGELRQGPIELQDGVCYRVTQ